MNFQQAFRKVLLCGVFAMAGSLTGCVKPAQEQQASAPTPQVTQAAEKAEAPAAPAVVEEEIDPFDPKAKSEARHKTSLATYKATMKDANAKLAKGEITREQFEQAKFDATVQKATDDADPTTISQGKRRGTIFKFSLKGSPIYTEGNLLEECKSGEGEMQLEVTTTDNSVTGSGGTSDVFKFSVSKNDKTLIQKFLAVVDSKHVVSVTYDQAIESNKCEFKTDYRITDILDITAQEEKDNARKAAAQRRQSAAELQRAATAAVEAAEAAKAKQQQAPGL